MGCGQSKIHLYPRKSKSKTNGKKTGNVDLVDADAEEDEGHREADKELNGNGKNHLRNEDDDGVSPNTELLDGKGDEALNGEISMLRGKNLSLLQSHDVLSSSQQNFFKMLDQKIDEGPDYDSTSETEIALEEARLNALVQHWESASLTASLCSSTSRSLQSTPVRQSQTNPPPMRMPMPQAAVMNANMMMSPKRVLQQPPPQGLMMQQQQQPQYQSQPMPQYMSHPQQQYIMAGGGGGMMRSGPGPRLLPVGGAVGLGNGMIATGLPPPPPQSQPNMGYYSQHPAMLQMAYSTTIPQAGNPNPVAAAYYGDLIQQHPLQVNPNQPSMNPMMGYGPMMTGLPMDVQMDSGVGVGAGGPMVQFPAAINVQRLAPQVQRQLRETQEMIKDSCPQLYGSPGPPGPMQMQMAMPMQQQQQQPMMGMGQKTGGSNGPPPPPRTSTLRKNSGPGPVANNNTSFETHSQEYS